MPAAVREALQAECATELATAGGEELLAVLGGRSRALDRFLIARNLKVDAAALMLRNTLIYRRDKVAKLMPIDPALKRKVAPFWPCSYCIPTVDGQPTMFARFGNLNPRKIYAEVSEEEFRTYYMWWMELALRHQLHCHNRQMLEVHDLNGLSFSQIYLPAVRLLGRTLKIGQDHYMEGLGRSIIINAPRIFSIAWKILRTALNERTRMKTVIVSDDGMSVLEPLFGSREAVELLLSTDVSGDREEKEGVAWLPPKVKYGPPL